MDKRESRPLSERCIGCDSRWSEYWKGESPIRRSWSASHLGGTYPEIFAELEKNIEAFSNQRAFQALLTDVEGKEYEFHIASNNGASSSILDLKQHRDIWPDVDFTTSIVLKSTTLASLVEREKLDIADYQALVLDTQGSELLVLQGGARLLDAFTYVKTEVPDFEAYEGCCQLKDIDSFMETHGFKEFSRKEFASRVEGGSYFDIVYRRAQ